MGTSFVRFGAGGFWIADGLLEVWLRLLALHIEDPVDSQALAAQIRNQWLLASRGFFNGSIPTGLDQAAATAEGMALVRAAIASLLFDLNNAPPRLSGDVLNLLGISGRFTTDLETQRLLEVGEAFLSLLDGKIIAGPEDSSFMPGSRPPNVS